MEMLNGELPRMLDKSIAKHSNWLASFQSPLMIRLLTYLECVLPAYTEWNAARALQGWSHPHVPSSVPVNSASLRRGLASACWVKFAEFAPEEANEAPVRS